MRRAHPVEFGDSLIEAYASVPKLANQLHLAVQSGSDRVLAAMNRRHSRADYLRIVERLRRARPDMAFTSDFIVGFPGETERDFEETLEVLEEVGFDSAFTFIFSPRRGTAAAELDGIRRAAASISPKARSAVVSVQGWPGFSGVAGSGSCAEQPASRRPRTLARPSIVTVGTPLRHILHKLGIDATGQIRVGDAMRERRGCRSRCGADQAEERRHQREDGRRDPCHRHIARGIDTGCNCRIDLTQGDFQSEHNGGVQAGAARSLQVESGRLGCEAAVEQALASEIEVSGMFQNCAGADVTWMRASLGLAQEQNEADDERLTAVHLDFGFWISPRELYGTRWMEKFR